MSCHDLPARAVTSPDGYPLAAEHPPLECRLMTGLRVLGLMFAFAVILVGLWIGLTPRNFTTSDARVPGTFTTACGSPFVPADSSGQCLAELNSRRTLAIATLAVGGVALVVLPLAARDRAASHRSRSAPPHPPA